MTEQLLGSSLAAPDSVRSPGRQVGLPRHIELETSRYCNRRCTWCPNGEHLARREQELMDWALFSRVLRELTGLGYAGWLAFHNYNEPLLNPRLGEELDAAHAMLPAARPAVFTNGDVLTAEWLADLVERGVRYVRVTRYPHRADTPASSASINQWISRAGLGALRWRHRPVRQGLAASAPVGEARIEVISPDILGTYNARGGSVTALPQLAAPRTEPCWMTATTAAIDYRGHFKMCCCVYPEPGSGHDRYVVGSLRDSTFAELWWSPQMDRWRARHAAADWSAPSLRRLPATTAGDPPMTTRVGRAAAPGRICLAGESLDWMSGAPSVVAAISLRTTASAHLADTCQELTIRSGPPINASRTIATAELGELTGDRLAYVQAVAYLAGSSWPTPPAGALHLRSELPVGAGVSSSASVTVATAAALLTAAHGVPPSPDTVARIAYRAERTAGSGAGWMDFLAVAHGGVNLIQATDPPAVALLADRLRTPVVLIDTLTRRSTRTLLAAKRSRWQAHDPDLLVYVEAAQVLVAKLADALRTPNPDHREIGQFVTQAHRLLADRVGCSTALIDACVDRCLVAGAYGAKLTGSGHGGCLFALVPADRVQAVLSALQLLPVKTLVLDGTDPGGVEATSETHRFEEDSVNA